MESRAALAGCPVCSKSVQIASVITRGLQLSWPLECYHKLIAQWLGRPSLYMLTCVHVNVSAFWSVPQSSPCLHHLGPALRPLNGFDYSEELGSVHVYTISQFLALKEKEIYLLWLSWPQGGQKIPGLFLSTVPDTQVWGVSQEVFL